MTHAVIFDVDGTLLKSSTVDETLYKAAIESVLGKVRFRPDLADYRYVSDAGILSQVLKDNNVRAKAGVIDAIKARFISSLQEHVDEFGPFEEIPGARRLVKRLTKSSYYEIAIATGGWRDTARFKLATAGFDIEAMPLASCDDAVDRAEIMRIALRSLGADIQSITYFGDGSWDAQACRSLSWQFRAVGPELHGILTFDDELIA